ncbi:hypothetical protein KC19_VG041100 [Ceratodon purpureus]|uniref:Uncharacterized protein n=1 Tax=Ceratodon purpureus TaxID=3225 RepID=A0A8T0HLV1_CERPU|nr:hypothetical protein KC19_VG041100 [Ceratodon purpureus]
MLNIFGVTTCSKPNKTSHEKCKKLKNHGANITIQHIRQIVLNTKQSHFQLNTQTHSPRIQHSGQQTDSHRTIVMYQNTLAKISVVFPSPTRPTKSCLVFVRYSSCLFSPILPICHTMLKRYNTLRNNLISLFTILCRS